jgi:tetratricopeptide (TPR) repeat protein
MVEFNSSLKLHRCTFFFFLIYSALLFACSLKAQSPDSVARASQLILEADSLTNKAFENEIGLEKYQKALAQDSLNYEALWKLSRLYVIIGEHFSITTDEQKEAQLQSYEEAVRYAERAISVKEDGSMGYVQRAAAKSRVALFKNIWKSSGLMNDVKEDCEKAIDLDPQNAIAYDVLGQAHMKLSERTKLFRWPFGVGWGNTDDAIVCFEKAISIDPNLITYRIDAARAYIEKKDYQKAQEHLSAAFTLPTLSGDDDRLRKEAANLLEQIKHK